MLTGTISGAALLLNVSGPGVSRLVKHAEESLRIRLFERKGGLFLPAPEARAVFDQINEVYGKIEGLQTAIANLSSGESGALAFLRPDAGVRLDPAQPEARLRASGAHRHGPARRFHSVREVAFHV
jgi:DNA-binding transcriptional LysR family regulator